MSNTSDILLYDTTLRDGTQGEQINFSAEEKLRIARRLDDLGFHYLEGGWPGSNPKDMRFFELAKGAAFRNARLTAFGSTKKASGRPEDCPQLQALLKAETPAVTIFGKSWDLQVTEILGIPRDENLEMITETLSFLRTHGKEVLFDAEHFFDGFKADPAYACQTLRCAAEAGADVLVLCDTNGGTLPHEVSDIVAEVRRRFPETPLGIHAHNDGGLAVANTLAAVRQGARMVQGTVNGFGERCGNADLVTVIGNLQLKMGRFCLNDDALAQLTNLSHYVTDIANVPSLSSRPFVGRSAFAHKGGVHVNAVAKNPAAYEHIDPARVGNRRRVLVSDMSGKTNIAYKARELGLDLGEDAGLNRRILETIKRMEDEGYQFDAADGSFSLLIRKLKGEFQDPFTLECFHVINGRTGDRPSHSQATIKISVGGVEELTAAEGNGPVNALDNALRKALKTFYPQVGEMHLVDFKVRIVEGSEGTAAKVKVLIESRDDTDVWSTIGVSENIIEASWQALVDSIQYKLAKDCLNKNA